MCFNTFIIKKTLGSGLKVLINKVSRADKWNKETSWAKIKYLLSFGAVGLLLWMSRMTASKVEDKVTNGRTLGGASGDTYGHEPELGYELAVTPKKFEACGQKT